MREILFRGKRLDNGEWMEGSLMKVTVAERTYYLIFGDGFAYDSETMKALAHACVDPDTVGQYIGMNDKNGKRIFEGDVVAQNWYSYNEPTNDSFGEVLFCESDCSFSVLDVERREVDALGRCGEYHWEIEVIGNIHDNPELLKGG